MALGYRLLRQRRTRIDLRPGAAAHALARCQHVYLRGEEELRRYSRRDSEDPASFHSRIVAGETDERPGAPGTGYPLGVVSFTEPTFACLYHGDVELPDGSFCCALFRDRRAATTAASELLS